MVCSKKLNSSQMAVYAVFNFVRYLEETPASFTADPDLAYDLVKSVIVAHSY